MSKEEFEWPSVADVADYLRDVSADYTPSEEDQAHAAKFGEECTCDVRLQVYPSGQWIVRTGSSDYDQDHRGYWGASGVPARGVEFDAEAVAENLIDQAREDYATSGGDE